MMVFAVVTTAARRPGRTAGRPAKRGGRQVDRASVRAGGRRRGRDGSLLTSYRRGGGRIVGPAIEARPGAGHSGLRSAARPTEGPAYLLPS